VRTPDNLRDQSRLYRDLAQKEVTLAIKRALASHAFVLAQLAERIERDNAIDASQEV